MARRSEGGDEEEEAWKCCSPLRRRLHSGEAGHGRAGQAGDVCSVPVLDGEMQALPQAVSAQSGEAA